jgi:thymidylate synthase (FAD)|tara:strand:- start:509 stop:1156 length:648 start_codon:yes stop_codon:yes gene_type:complete
VDYLGSDLSVVNSARVSFGNHKAEIDEQDKRLIRYLIRHNHTSTLEHNVSTFRFKVPLFVRSQHHRHRTWSYNEISRRYTDFNIEFYEPEVFRTQHESNRQASNLDEINPVLICGSDCNEAVELHHQMSLDLYDKMIAAGVCREQARGILPQNMYTEYYGTANLNNLLKFVDLRIHEGAQWEIQCVAEAILEIMRDLWPTTVAAYQDIRRETIPN